MDKFPFDEFREDFIIKVFIQEKQYNQWLNSFFYLNNELSKKYDFVYQEAFYIKFYELLTEGIEFANDILSSLKIENNDRKFDWYSKFVDGITSIKTELSNPEFLYIEYKRHCASHIFQNSYEIIQKNLKIKKERNNKNLSEIRTEIQNLITKYGNDKNVDMHINSLVQQKITNLYNNLT